MNIVLHNLPIYIRLNNISEPKKFSYSFLSYMFFKVLDDN
jgi:hypothetical protein